MLIEVSSNIRSNYMLHHLAQYTSQGDGPIIGGSLFSPFLKMGLILENGAFIGIKHKRLLALNTIYTSELKYIIQQICREAHVA